MGRRSWTRCRRTGWRSPSALEEIPSLHAAAEPAGTRTSTSASGLRERFNCGRGRPRTMQPPNPAGTRRPRPHPSRERFNCGRGRPRTMQPPNPAGTRTSTSASVPCKGSIAGGDARVPWSRRTPRVRERPRPHPGAVQGSIAGGDARVPCSRRTPRVRGRPRPHPGSVQGSIAGGDARVPWSRRTPRVRGRPRPHPGSVQGLRVRTPAYVAR